MAYTTINKSSEHFNTKLYTGTGSSQSVTGVGFQPDFTWIKQRSGTEQNVLFDAVRGVQKYIASNTTAAEATTATTLTAFNADGFTEGGHGMTGANGSTYASWNWKAGGGQGSSNTDGSINTTYTSVNTTSGFSISKYTGTGANATVGHGLGAVPKMIITKNLQQGNEGWLVYHASMGNTKKCNLNSGGDFGTDATAWNSTTPTNDVFSIGTNWGSNGNGHPMVAYCFADKKGYSKFGSYVGNGNSNGTFVYTGFKPAFVMFKNNYSATHWQMYDTTRNTFNVIDDLLRANESNAENTNDANESIDILSNGFKCRGVSNANNNWSGNTYIYMAFGQSIVGSNNVPATGR